MEDNHSIISSRHHTSKASTKSYLIGYILSLVLTVVPFVIVVEKMVWGWALILVLSGFAIAQVLVQLNYFIHLGYEQKPRWSRIAFTYMLLCLAILVIGSLWIMYNLDYNMGRAPGHGEHQTMPEEGF